MDEEERIELEEEIIDMTRNLQKIAHVAATATNTFWELCHPEMEPSLLNDLTRMFFATLMETLGDTNEAPV